MNIEPINPNGMPADQRLYSTDELAVFLGGSADSWTGLFLRLVGKSDPEHRSRLAEGFPGHVRAWEMWQALPEPTVGALTAALLT